MVAECVGAQDTDDNDREHTKAFVRKVDAQNWLDTDITPALSTGTYVAPRAERITVCEMYSSWSNGQGAHRRQDGCDLAQRVGSRVEPHGATWPWST